MKGRLGSILGEMARGLLLFCTFVGALLAVPALVMVWLGFNDPGFNEQDRRLAFKLLEILGIVAPVGVACFLLVRRSRFKAPQASDWLFGAFLSVALALLVAGDFLLHLPAPWMERIGWAIATFAVLMIGGHLCVAGHELGHVLAALGAGLQPLHFRVGSGPLLWRGIGSGGLLVEWRLLPSGGFHLAGRPDGRFSRWREWVHVAGGPVASLVLTFALWRLFEHWSLAGIGAWAYARERLSLALLVWSGLLLLCSMVPVQLWFDDRVSCTDGLQLIRLLRRPAHSPAELAKAVHVQRISFFWESGQRARARVALADAEASLTEPFPWLELARGIFASQEGDHAVGRAALERYLAAPGEPAELRREALRLVIYACAHLRDARAARAHCVSLLRGLPRDGRVASLDVCASAPVNTGRPELLPHARRWIKRALRIEPGNLDLQLTDALLLVEQGEGPRAEASLRQLAGSTLEAGPRGVAAIYLARVLHERQAPADEIEHWRERALRWYPDSPLVRRVGAELTAK